MARKAAPLTDTQVKQAKPKEKDYELSDGEGLTLRIRKSGTKVWLLKYQKTFTKKRSNLALGNYPILTLANARKLKQEARELLSQDIDPKEHREQTALREEQAHNATFENVAARYHEIKKTSVSQDHAQDIWRSLELHAFPELGNIPVHKLSAPRTLKALSPLSNRSPETGKRISPTTTESYRLLWIP